MGLIPSVNTTLAYRRRVAIGAGIYDFLESILGQCIGIYRPQPHEIYEETSTKTC